MSNHWLDPQALEQQRDALLAPYRNWLTALPKYDAEVLGILKHVWQTYYAGCDAVSSVEEDVHTIFRGPILRGGKWGNSYSDGDRKRRPWNGLQYVESLKQEEVQLKRVWRYGVLYIEARLAKSGITFEVIDYRWHFRGTGVMQSDLSEMHNHIRGVIVHAALPPRPVSREPEATPAVQQTTVAPSKRVSGKRTRRRTSAEDIPTPVLVLLLCLVLAVIAYLALTNQLVLG